MRKHFLLLFLMALLPLAGWAADGDITEPTGKTNLTYSGEAQSLLATAGSVEGTNYAMYYYVSTTESTPAWSTTTWTKTSADVKGTNAGTYYVYFAAYNENTQAAPVIGSYISVTIAKCALTADVKTADYFVKAFLAEDPAKPAKADVTITGAPIGIVVADLVDVANTIEYSYTGENANATAAGALFTGSTGYAITFDGIALKSTAEANYDLTISPRVMKIKQIALTSTEYATDAAAGKFTVTRVTSYNPLSKPLYTGVAQNATYSVKYYYTATEFYEMQATDVKVQYKNSTTTYPDAIDALDYTAVVTFVENGNFSGSNIELGSADALNYGIGKNNVFVMLNPNSKVYDGYKFKEAGSTETAPSFNFSGLKGKDAGKAVTGLAIANVDPKTGVTLKKDAAKYTMIVNQAAAEAAEINYPAVYYTAEEAIAYNATLEGHLTAGVALDATDAGKYNTALAPATNKNAGDTLTPAEAAAYNATLTGAKTTADEKVAASTAALSKNYNVTCVSADWEITKKALTVTATSTPITYGEDPATAAGIAISAEGALQIDLNEDGDYEDAEEVDESLDIIASYKGTTAAAAALVIGNNVITVSKKAAADYADYNTSTKTSATYTAHEAVLKNYTINIVNGTLVVNGVGFTIIPNIAATMEYGATPAPTYAAFNNTTYASVTTAKKPTYLYRQSTEAASAATTTVPTAVGSYIVSIQEDATLAPAGYEPTLTVYEETPFEITKKTLDFTISPVTLHNGDTKTTLNQYAKIILKDGYSYVGEEKIAPEFTFKTGVAGLTVGSAAQDYAITGTEGTTYVAIEASLPEGVADNDNYTLKAGYTLGNLTIATGRKLYIAGNDVYVNNKISDAAIACAADAAIKYDVTFAPRTLVANDWNVVVLPFDITPYEFTEAIKGYAIFNTLKSANTTNNTVKFGLGLANLPANEPFLVKPLNEVKLQWASDDDNNPATPDVIHNIEFANRVVEYATTPEKTDVAGVKFIGTYLDTHVLVAGDDPDADFAFVADGGEAGSKISFLAYPTTGKGQFYSAVNEAGDQSYNWLNLTSTKAYFDFNSSSLSRPTIIVEEADGSTTAISEFTTDGVAVKAEGWYTIDGMKLNAAPTQKGIYINNGKKIVVK